MERVSTPGLDPKLRQIAELIDVGVILLAADQEIDFISPRAEEIVGIPLERGADWEDLLDSLRETIDDSWKRRVSGTAIHREVNVDGVGRVVSFSVFFLDEDECLGFLMLVRDVRVQRAVEADFALAAQLRSLNSLYAGLAHDLRSPLNTIVLHLELMKQEPNGGSERLEQGLCIVEEELERLTGSLDLFISQTVTPDDEPAAFDLHELVREVGRLLAGQARHQLVDLEVSTSAEPLCVEASRVKLRQALINLGVNGLEATSEGGKLSFRVEEEDDCVTVRVEDDGPGVPEPLREHIFVLHYTTKPDGSGLGLYFSRAAAAAAGGSLEVEEGSGGGARFVLSLPVADLEGDEEE